MNSSLLWQRNGKSYPSLEVPKKSARSKKNRRTNINIRDLLEIKLLKKQL